MRRTKSQLLSRSYALNAGLLVAVIGLVGAYGMWVRLPASADQPATTTTTPTLSAASFTPADMRTLPDPLYGVTVDDVSNVSAIAASSKALSRKPITRVVFDEGALPSQYTSAINTLQPDSFIMGELLDSEGLAKSTPAQYHDRTAQYLAALGGKVDLWEVGNEVNGDWTGTYASVGEKISDAYRQVKAAGKRSALTLWYNPGCPSSAKEIDPVAFSRSFVPADMKAGLDYVFISYYETQCNNYRPSAAVLTTLFNELRAQYPSARLGFGEVGLPDAVTPATQAKANSILNYYYSLKLDVPGYVGGYFWWYYYEDMLPHTTKPMWAMLNGLMQNMATPGPTSAPTQTPSPSTAPTTAGTPSPVNTAGDTNGDGKVNAVDLSRLLANWGRNFAPADFNKDGIVNTVDLSILLGRWTG